MNWSSLFPEDKETTKICERLDRIAELISDLQSENAYLERDNARLDAQNTAQLAQITDLLGVLAEITEDSAKPSPDLHNLREQISRYVTGMEIRSRASASPS